jgi:hypothetical protein
VLDLGQREELAYLFARAKRDEHASLKS